MNPKLTVLLATVAVLLAACSEHVAVPPKRTTTAPAGSTTVTPPTAPIPPDTGVPSTPYSSGSTPPARSGNGGTPTNPNPNPTPTPTQPACTPIAGSGPHSQWVPPNPLKHPVCSAQEAQVVAACFTLGGQYCNQLSAVNPNCVTCAVSSAGSPTYGALVQYDQYHAAAPNIAGCISALTGNISNTSCGAAWLAEDDCEYASCAHCAQQDYAACTAAAATTTCAQTAAAAACAQQALGICVRGSSDVDIAINMIGLFCMP